jgi:hypothetical protein
MVAAMFKLLLARRVISVLAAAGMFGGGAVLTHEAVSTRPAPDVADSQAVAGASDAAATSPRHRRDVSSWAGGHRTAAAPSAPAQSANTPSDPSESTTTETTTTESSTTENSQAGSSTAGESASRSTGTTPTRSRRTNPTAPAGTTTEQSPAGTAVASSGTAAPAADLPGWHLTLSQDFTTDAALGSFSRTYPGWSGYDGGKDTSRNGTYDSASVVSVQNGVVDEYLHPSGGGARVAALTPPMSGQTYGRYSVRFRADQVPGYKIAWLLWPTSENWSQGELDFPEADLDGSIAGFSHTIGSPSSNAWAMDTNATMDSWHTATLEWSPGQLTYTLDGKSWTSTNTRGIPTDPMRWVLQTETSLGGDVPTAGAHVYVDWVAAWSRA